MRFPIGLFIVAILVIRASVLFFKLHNYLCKYHPELKKKFGICDGFYNTFKFVYAMFSEIECDDQYFISLKNKAKRAYLVALLSIPIIGLIQFFIDVVFK